MKNILLITPEMKNPNGGIAVWTKIYKEKCDLIEINPLILNTSLIGKRLKNSDAKRNIFDEIKRTSSIFKNLKKLLNNKIDVIHLNTSCATYGIIRDYLIVKKAKTKNRNAKIVVQYHCDIPSQIGRGHVGSFFLKRILKLNVVNLVLCESSQSYLKNKFAVESIKVPNFIDDNIVLQSNKIITDKIEKVVFVGRFSKEKGAKEIEETAKFFPDIMFEIIGNHPEDSEQNNISNLYFLGELSREKVISKLDNADIFLFPSHTEGFSIALLEAMSRGVPSIVTDVGANKDMIEDKGGMIISSGDIGGIISAINHMQDPLVRQEMSRWCLLKVNRYYLSTSVIQQLMGIYE